MTPLMDFIFVALTVSAAVAYLIRRKIRRVRKLERDWTSGRVDACDSCPVIEIKKRQRATR